jgi:hypothetical protein
MFWNGASSARATWKIEVLDCFWTPRNQKHIQEQRVLGARQVKTFSDVQ